MGLEWEQTNVDAKDPVLLGRWWQQALRWVVVNDAPDEFEIRSAPDRLPGLLFVAVPESKTVKNRLHLDFRPDDQDLEVACSRWALQGSTLDRVSGHGSFSPIQKEMSFACSACVQRIEGSTRTPAITWLTAPQSPVGVRVSTT